MLRLARRRQIGSVSASYTQILHDPPRNFRSLGREEQQQVLDQRLPTTGTRWDALLAATVEHVCELHGPQPPAWLEESERFLKITWILPTTPTMVKEAIARRRELVSKIVDDKTG